MDGFLANPNWLMVVHNHVSGDDGGAKNSDRAEREFYQKALVKAVTASI